MLNLFENSNLLLLEFFRICLLTCKDSFGVEFCDGFAVYFCADLRF